MSVTSLVRLYYLLTIRVYLGCCKKLFITSWTSSLSCVRTALRGLQLSFEAVHVLNQQHHIWYRFVLLLEPPLILSCSIYWMRSDDCVILYRCPQSIQTLNITSSAICYTHQCSFLTGVFNFLSILYLSKLNVYKLASIMFFELVFLFCSNIVIYIYICLYLLNPPSRHNRVKSFKIQRPVKYNVLF